MQYTMQHCLTVASAKRLLSNKDITGPAPFCGDSQVTKTYNTSSVGARKSCLVFCYRLFCLSCELQCGLPFGMLYYHYGLGSARAALFVLHLSNNFAVKRHAVESICLSPIITMAINFLFYKQKIDKDNPHFEVTFRLDNCLDSVFFVF